MTDAQTVMRLVFLSAALREIQMDLQMEIDSGQPSEILKATSLAFLSAALKEIQMGL